MSVKLAVAAVLVSACSTQPTSECGPTSAMVMRAVDGDTIELASGEKVRYLLVDTNEISEGTCYAEEARAYNAMLVEGKTVTLVYDEECTDRFGRLLAYVSVAGREVNTLLVERGYACVLYIPPDGTARRHEFETLESTARSERRGMWGACEEVACAK